MRLSKFDQFLNFRKAYELVFEFFDLISNDIPSASNNRRIFQF